jgi:hypothetical protein
MNTHNIHMIGRALRLLDLEALAQAAAIYPFPSMEPFANCKETHLELLSIRVQHPQQSRSLAVQESAHGGGGSAVAQPLCGPPATNLDARPKGCRKRPPGNCGCRVG